VFQAIRTHWRPVIRRSKRSGVVQDVRFHVRHHASAQNTDVRITFMQLSDGTLRSGHQPSSTSALLRICGRCSRG